MNEPTRRPNLNDTSAVVTMWTSSLVKRVNGTKQHYFPMTTGRKVSSYAFSATVRSLISPAKTYAAIIARGFSIPEHPEASAESPSSTTRSWQQIPNCTTLNDTGYRIAQNSTDRNRNHRTAAWLSKALKASSQHLQIFPWTLLSSLSRSPDGLFIGAHHPCQGEGRAVG